MNSLTIKNQTETSADLFIYGDIVSSEWDKWNLEDVAPEGIRNFLEEIKGKDLNIFINSGGGSVFGGMAIYSQLIRHREMGNKITVHVDGLAGSIASVIALAGDKIIIPKNAFFMIHRAWVGVQGNANDLKKMADTLERIDETIFSVYQKNIKDGVDEKLIKKMVDAETWLNGEQASQFFNIETTEELEAVACVSDYFKNYSEIPSELTQEEEPKEEIEQEEEIKEDDEPNLEIIDFEIEDLKLKISLL